MNHAYLSLSHLHSQGLGDSPGRRKKQTKKPLSSSPGEKTSLREAAPEGPGLDLTALMSVSHANGINCSECSQSLQAPPRKIVKTCVFLFRKRPPCNFLITAHRGKIAPLGPPSEQLLLLWASTHLAPSSFGSGASFLAGAVAPL